MPAKKRATCRFFISSIELLLCCYDLYVCAVLAAVACIDRYNSIIAVSQSNHHHHKDVCRHHLVLALSMLYSRLDERGRRNRRKKGESNSSSSSSRESNRLLLSVSLPETLHHHLFHLDITKKASPPSFELYSQFHL